MSNKKQTAVEWLLSQLEHQVSEDGKQTMSLTVTGYLREQAKEMEKQQIVNAYINGKYESDLVVMSDKYYAEQYYNETFNT